MRDHAEEIRLLEEAADLCQRVYGQNSTPFPRLVLERLAIGADTYGDFAFMHRDNLVEALPEGADGAAYPILEYQRLAPGLNDADRAELRQATLGVIAAAVNLDTSLRRLHHLRDELLS